MAWLKICLRIEFLQPTRCWSVCTCNATRTRGTYNTPVKHFISVCLAWIVNPKSEPTHRLQTLTTTIPIFYLKVLSGRVIQPNMPQQQNGSMIYDEDMGYRTMTRDEAAMIQQINTPSTVHTPISQQPSAISQNIPQSPPNAQGHHRTSR